MANFIIPKKRGGMTGRSGGRPSSWRVRAAGTSTAPRSLGCDRLWLRRMPRRSRKRYSRRPATRRETRRSTWTGGPDPQEDDRRRFESDSLGWTAERSAPTCPTGLPARRVVLPGLPSRSAIWSQGSWRCHDRPRRHRQTGPHASLDGGRRPAWPRRAGVRDGSPARRSGRGTEPGRSPPMRA